MSVVRSKTESLGSYAPPSAARVATGRLGVRFDRIAYESSARMRVMEVFPLGPAALAGIRAGDEIVTVDGTFITSRTNLGRKPDAQPGHPDEDQRAVWGMTEMKRVA